MSTLKEIKTRVNSVRSSRKITSAMMMIASSKLVKIEKVITNLYPYEMKMNQLMTHFVNSDTEYSSPFAVRRDVKRATIVVFSSNSGLAGRFNEDVADRLKFEVDKYRKSGVLQIDVLAIGNKVRESASKMGFENLRDFRDIVENPEYENSKMIAKELMESFLKEQTDEVMLIYHHFKNKKVQNLVTEIFLPLSLNKTETGNKSNIDYIVEPDRATLMDHLVPKTLKLKLYTVHVDAVASEHAARTMAMQTATDNADDLLQELTLQYNKLRQQSITSELLDIAGGTSD